VESLRNSWRRAGVPINDSWIAATALAHGLSLVTLEFNSAPGLDVIRG
jgi:predicted nucleic acid-binding protein